LKDANTSRLQLNEQLKQVAAGGEASDELKQFLFDDGIVTEVLKYHELIETDIAGRPSRMKPAASCIISKFAPNFTGGILDIGAKFVGIATGGRFVQVRGSGFFNRPTKTDLALMVGVGGTGTQVDEIVKTVRTSCYSEAGRAPRAKSQEQTLIEVSMAALDLPSEVGFGMTTLEIDREKIPACLGANGMNLTIQEHQAHCAWDVITNALNIRKSLGALAIRGITE